jgi:hypothetical protein
MTEFGTPFDAQPDPVLGAALRHALNPTDAADPADQARFVARVLAAADAAPVAAPTWEVLSGWAARGIAAAALAALLAGLLVARVPAANAGDDEATIALLRGQRPADASVELATADDR